MVMYFLVKYMTYFLNEKKKIYPQLLLGEKKLPFLQGPSEAICYCCHSTIT